jgi:hypothetical protein
MKAKKSLPAISVKVWPAARLGPNIQGRTVRVFSVTNDSSARSRELGEDNRMPWQSPVENLAFNLLYAGVGKDCPIILVGHRLGASVIKLIIFHLLDRIEKPSSAPCEARPKGRDF